MDDRIKIALINVDPKIIKNFGDYIKAETLATSIEKDISNPDQFEDIDKVTIKVKR